MKETTYVTISRGPSAATAQPLVATSDQHVVRAALGAIVKRLSDGSAEAKEEAASMQDEMS